MLIIKEERTKFNVDKDKAKRTFDGIVFDSVTEMKFYRDVVCPLVESGDVVDVKLQQPYELQPKFVHDEKNVKAITYVADFVLYYKDGHFVVIDIKGCPDSVALLKRKLFWYKYPDIEYVWLCYSKIDGGWCTYEKVKKCRAERKRQKKAKLAKEEREGSENG